MPFLQKHLLLGQRLKAAIPSSLVGLVTFSFVLMGFGATVYTAALPALVETSPVVQEAAVVASEAKAAITGEPTADAQRSDQSASGSTDAGEKSQSSASQASVGIGGISGLGGLGLSSDRGSHDEAADSADAADAPGDKKAEDEKPAADATADANASGNKHDEKPADNGGGGDAGVTDPADGRAAEEAAREADRLYLVDRTNDVQALAGRLSQVKTDLEANFAKASPAECGAYGSACNFLHDDAMSLMVEISNHQYQSNAYSAQGASLVTMCSAMYQFCDAAGSAWSSAQWAGSERERSDVYDHYVGELERQLGRYNEAAGAFSL